MTPTEVLDQIEYLLSLAAALDSLSSDVECAIAIAIEDSPNADAFQALNAAAAKFQKLADKLDRAALQVDPLRAARQAIAIITCPKCGAKPHELCAGSLNEGHTHNDRIAAAKEGS